MKCEYCGEKIGLMSVRFTWIDKQNDRAVHDKCLEEYKKKTSKKGEQTSVEKQIQKDNNETIKNRRRNIILGVLLIIMSILAVISSAIGLFVTDYGGPSMITIILIILGFVMGIELFRSKGKRQFIFGIILLVIYLILWVLLPLTVAFL